MKFMDTIAYFKLKDILVLCLGDADLSDEDFNKWTLRFRQYDWKQLMVYARGSGVITADQRDRIAEMYDEYRCNFGTSMKVTLVTDKLFPRIVANLVNQLTGHTLKAFGSNSLSKALEYVGAEINLKELENALNAVYLRLE